MLTKFERGRVQTAPPTNVVQLEDRMEQGTSLVAAIHGNMQSIRKEILWEAGILALKDRQKRTARTAGNRYKNEILVSDAEIEGSGLCFARAGKQ